MLIANWTDKYGRSHTVRLPDDVFFTHVPDEELKPRTLSELEAAGIVEKKPSLKTVFDLVYQ